MPKILNTKLCEIALGTTFPEVKRRRWLFRKFCNRSYVIFWKSKLANESNFVDRIFENSAGEAMPGFSKAVVPMSQMTLMECGKLSKQSYAEFGNAAVSMS